MARRLRKANFVRARQTKYPWNKWTDGSAWEVEQGKDFTCVPGSLIVYLYTQASQRGLLVRTQVIRPKSRRGEEPGPTRIQFQFYEREELKTGTKKLKKGGPGGGR